jgi:hypothetical protein
MGLEMKKNVMDKNSKLKWYMLFIFLKEYFFTHRDNGAIVIGIVFYHLNNRLQTFQTKKYKSVFSCYVE